MNRDNNIVISAHDLWKIYQMGRQEVHALCGVTFNIHHNEMVAIMGPSGSGKSTLMNLIGCLDTPSRGEYLLKGENVSEFSENDLFFASFFILFFCHN